MTIKDIARLGGVSTATVSRVLNNHCVGKKTKEKILKIIKKYEYYPNPFARYLGQRSKKRIMLKNVTVYNKI
ncbi:MAG: LacI family DNA-binding transcriptional regulator [Candidatus Omnitrophica bacterium]|nr:LacI family DNA-binding transcriptional regulator [Candidatus Omnitrophota bacterium]